MRAFTIDQAFAEKLEREYAERVEELDRSLDAELDELDEFDTLAAFCGCDTCWSRELLAFLIPRIVDGYRAGLIEVPESADVPRST